MSNEISPYFENCIVVQRKVLFSKFVLMKHLNREIEGSWVTIYLTVVVKEYGDLSLVTFGWFVQFIADFAHIGIDEQRIAISADQFYDYLGDILWLDSFASKDHVKFRQQRLLDKCMAEILWTLV